MNRSALAVAALSLAVATLCPLHAVRADDQSSSSGGVEVIDMSAPPPTAAPAAKKPATKPSGAPAASGAGTSLAGATTLLHNALAYLGVPFVMGGTSPSGFDCSGFAQFAFASVGIRIPRTADLQFYGGRAIAGDPLPGDLVFFQTYEYGPSHVGIYLGDGRFVNAIGKDVHIDRFVLFSRPISRRAPLLAGLSGRPARYERVPQFAQERGRVHHETERLRRTAIG
jgi:cell wall-associated NlpC family hydrolase